MKTIGHSYKQHPIADRWDAIVIGSGIGGLSTAALLAKYAGQRVLVLERHYTAGGYTHAFRRPGYEWDAGVHYIGAVNDRESPVRAGIRCRAVQTHRPALSLRWPCLVDWAGLRATRRRLP